MIREHPNLFEQQIAHMRLSPGGLFGSGVTLKEEVIKHELYGNNLKYLQTLHLETVKKICAYITC